MTTVEISEIINNLIFLQKNTVPTAGNYGADITSLLQQNYDQLSLNKIKFYLQQAIASTLSDVSIEQLNVILTINNQISVNLQLLQISTNTYFETSYTL